MTVEVQRRTVGGGGEVRMTVGAEWAEWGGHEYRVAPDEPGPGEELTAPAGTAELGAGFDPAAYDPATYET